MAFTSVLKPENSIVAGIATMALVAGLYGVNVGPVSSIHMGPANDNNTQASLKKAGWISVIAVSGVSLLAKDANIAILGGATIIAEELQYRHANMASPETGQIEINPAAYIDAGTSYVAGAQGTDNY
jgi:hypothetical protein